MKRLYDENPYLVTWETEISEVLEKNGKFYIALNETAFYPEGGGQPGDKGKIDNQNILDLIEENNVVYHILESKPQNSKVTCHVNWDRRYDLMQQHTGQHLLSAVFYNLYKGETSSFHLGDDYVSIDISLSDISSSTLSEVEKITNDYIYSNLDIITHVVKPEEVERFPLRKLPPAADSIRIVEIDKIDYSPCCGTHVRKTGELGMIKILKTEKYKGITRVYFKCGRRALYDYQVKNEIILNLGRYLSVPENEIASKIECSVNEIKSLTKQMSDIKDKLYQYEAVNIIKNSNDDKVSLVFDDKSFSEVQLLSKQLLLNSNNIYLLASTSDLKVMLCHNGNFNIDCGKLFKENLAEFSGKGGGGSKQAQAGFTNKDDLMKFKSRLLEII